VAEPPPLTERELRFVRALVRHQVRFLIVGLSAAALQGAPVVTQDVDLWFDSLEDPNLAAALRQVGGAYVPPTAYTPPMFAGDQSPSPDADPGEQASRRSPEGPSGRARA